MEKPHSTIASSKSLNKHDVINFPYHVVDNLGKSDTAKTNYLIYGALAHVVVI
jgi:hypothetical protein